MSELTIRINGEERTFPAGRTVTDVLADLGLADKRVAVERNGDIIPRSLHPETEVHEGDRIEIVNAIGGG